MRTEEKCRDGHSKSLHDVATPLLFWCNELMSIDTSPRRDDPDSKFAFYVIVAAIVLLNVALAFMFL